MKKGTKSIIIYSIVLFAVASLLIVISAFAQGKVKQNIDEKNVFSVSNALTAQNETLKSQLNGKQSELEAKEVEINNLIKESEALSHIINALISGKDNYSTAVVIAQNLPNIISESSISSVMPQINKVYQKAYNEGFERVRGMNSKKEPDKMIEILNNLLYFSQSAEDKDKCLDRLIELYIGKNSTEEAQKCFDMLSGDKIKQKYEGKF